MISISCLESKLLNNNNWYGRFQLAPFQKGEGLTVANALRRTLLAEKRAFFITWVDFYNAEIPYSVLTGMRESIFDILLNLKQVIFTSDKILPRHTMDNHFFTMRSNHNHVRNLNQKQFTTQNVFCENQILGKIVNSKNQTRLRIFHKDSDFKNQLLDTRFSVGSHSINSFGVKSQAEYQNALRVPKTMSDSTYIGYICAKGPTTIYAKNIKLPKGLKCVDPDKYITTLADDGLFYLRFALTTTIKTLSMSDSSNISNRIHDGIKFNRVRLRIFPKTLLNNEIQSCFNRKTDPLVLNQEKKSKKSNQYDLNTSQIPFLESYSKRVKQERQIKNSLLQGKKKLSRGGLDFLRPPNAKNSTVPYVQDTDKALNASSKQSSRNFQQWPVHNTRLYRDLINKQCLLLTNDSIKQLDFQNTSIIANIQKTCLLNIQIKHYYYKCGRFDRFLFDLIKPFKPHLIATHSKKPGLKNNKGLAGKRIFSYSDSEVLTKFSNRVDPEERIVERQKSNSYLLINYKRNSVKKALFLKKKHFKRGSERVDKLSNLFSLQSHEKSKLEFQTPNTNITLKGPSSLSSFNDPFTPICFVSKHTRCVSKKENFGTKFSFVDSYSKAIRWNLKNKYWFPNDIPDIRSQSFTPKWQHVFQSLRTNSIYNYLQKLNTSQGAQIYKLLINSSPESKILLLGSQLILNRDPQTRFFSTRLISILKNRYLKSDPFSQHVRSHADNLWSGPDYHSLSGLASSKAMEWDSKENTEKQLSQFLFREFVSPPVNKLTGGLQIQKNVVPSLWSDLRIKNEEIYNTSTEWQIFRLHELYIKKFLNACFLFQCSKNYVLYFLKSTAWQILKNNNSPGYREETSFLNLSGGDSAHLKNISRYSPFKFGLVDTEKLITKIKFLRQWSVLNFKHEKQTRISLLNKKTRDHNETTSITNLFLMRQRKSPQGQELLYSVLQSQNKTLKYDIHVREFFFSKNTLPIVICPSFNKYPSFFPSSHIAEAAWPEKRNQTNRILNDWPKKTTFLSTPPFRSSKIPQGDQVQISTNLRAKPSISIQQLSYKPLWILPCQVEKNTPAAVKLSLWFDHLSLSNPKPNITNNKVILKPIYLNVEQIIYILKQTTQFRKNQRINPVFLDSLTRLKNKKRYPLDYSSLFSKRSTYLYNSFYNPRYRVINFLFNWGGFFNNRVSPYFSFYFQTRSYFFQQENIRFYKRKINQRKTIPPYFIDAKTPVGIVYHGSYNQKPFDYHVRILGHDFVFKNNNREKKHDSLNINKDFNCFFLVSFPAGPSLFSNSFPLFSKRDFSKLHLCENLSNEPYNINICHSIISFNLRYTYPFKSTIFETRLPFLNFSKNLQSKLNSSKRNYYPLRPTRGRGPDFFRVQGSKASSFYHLCGDFDHIQYNESFKIYTSLAYTCLNTREAHLPKYHNFNRRNQKGFQNNANKTLSFQHLSGKQVRQGDASRIYPAGTDKREMLFESLIQDWAFFRQKDNGIPLSEKNEKSNSYPFLIPPCEGLKLPNVLNYRSTAYRWHNINTLPGTDFNDAFIISPRTWLLNPYINKLYEYKLRNFKTTASLFYSFVPSLQKLHLATRLNGADHIFQNPKVFFESVGKKTEILKNRLDWLKTRITTNEVNWLRSYGEKNFYDFRLNSPQGYIDKEDTYFVSPLTNLRVPKEASFLWPFNELNGEIRALNEHSPLVDTKGEPGRYFNTIQQVGWRDNTIQRAFPEYKRGTRPLFSEKQGVLGWPDMLNDHISTFEQNPDHLEDFQRPNISSGGFQIKRSIKKLAINFENVYYKNLLWNSRKITLRVLNNAILPLVTNRKYSISNFLPKKNYQATRFFNIRDTAREPVYFSLSPKFSNRFIWGFKQKIRPYFSSARVLKTDTWSRKKPNNLVLQKNPRRGGKNWLNQPYLFNEFSGGTHPEGKIYHDEKYFYSVRHKTLATTNFMCCKTYPTLINENATQNIPVETEPNSSIKIPNESTFENNFSYTNSTFSNQKIDKFSNSPAGSLKKRKVPSGNYWSSLTPSLKPISEITNESYTPKSRSYGDFFSESFSSLRSKWKPFFRGSLKHSQEKTTRFESQFIDLGTQHQKSASFNPVARQNQRFADNDFKTKSPLMDNLWSSLFFCSHSLYAISTGSDLFFQNLINNDNWTPSTNKATQIPQINSSNYMALYSSVRPGYGEKTKELFFKDSLINSKANDRMQLQYEQSNTNQYGQGDLKLSLPTELYHEAIQKILVAQSSQGRDHKSLWPNRIVSNYNYYWQKAIHLIVLSRFQPSLTDFNRLLSEKQNIGFNGYTNQRVANSFLLQYPKKNVYTSQNFSNRLKNRYSIRRLKNFERYFGNPVRRHINQNWYLTGIPMSFCNILLPSPTKKLCRVDSPRSLLKKANPPQGRIKSWKSIISTVNVHIYFCFRYPLFIQNCNLPWQKSKRVFGTQKNWLNRNKEDFKPVSLLNCSTYFSKRLPRETGPCTDFNGVLNTKLMMNYTQLSSSSNKTHQVLLHNKLWTNLILPINTLLQTKGSYGMIGYFTIKESLNSIYKVNYIVESQASESKSMSELAVHSMGPRSTSAFLNSQASPVVSLHANRWGGTQKSGRVPVFEKNRDANLTRNPNQGDSDGFLKSQNSIENFHNMKKFDNIQRNSVNTDALTVSNFLNATYSFVPSKTIILNQFNPLTNSQINTSRVENENEYIQIDIWTNGELSPRQALLNAFRKLFELFYNLSKYNCLKPIEI